MFKTKHAHPRRLSSQSLVFSSIPIEKRHKLRSLLTVTADGTSAEDNEAIFVLKGGSNEGTSLGLLHVDRDTSKGSDGVDLHRQ